MQTDPEEWATYDDEPPAGVQAVIYGFPYIYYAQLRHAWVTNKRDLEVVPSWAGSTVGED